MEQLSNGIGKVGLNQRRDSISLWNVYIPYGVDRDVYINNSFLSNTVCLINDNAEIVNRVKIGKLSLQLIDFPKDQNSLGSEVVCVTVPYSGELRVVDVYAKSNQYNYQKENQYRLIKQNGIGIANISIDGSGNINIGVDGDTDNGIVTLNITNKDRNGKLNINVNGSLNIINDGKTFIQTSQEIELQHKEDNTITSVNIQKQLVTISTDKLVVNSDNEPMLLGQKTVDLISDLLDQLAKESAGPYPLLHQAQYTEIKSKIEQIKSKKSFLD